MYPKVLTLQCVGLLIVYVAETGIVVNIPTTKGLDGRSAGESGSKLRDEYIQRGFNPTRVRPLWNYWGHSGTAIVEFNKDWNGLHNALLFDKVIE